MFKQAGRQRRRESSCRDSGVTFVELLITIVLMGTVVLGVLTATQVLIRASRTNHEAASVTSALLAAAERIERAPRTAFQCDGATWESLVHAAAELKLGVSAAQAANYVDLGYQHLQGNTWVDGACPAGGFHVNLVQRIHVTMIGPDTGLERKLEVIKGDV